MSKVRLLIQALDEENKKRLKGKSEEYIEGYYEGMMTFIKCMNNTNNDQKKMKAFEMKCSRSKTIN